MYSSLGFYPQQHSGIEITLQMQISRADRCNGQL